MTSAQKGEGVQICHKIADKQCRGQKIPEIMWTSYMDPPCLIRGTPHEFLQRIMPSNFLPASVFENTRADCNRFWLSLSFSNMMLAVGCETNAHLSIPSPLLVKDQRSQILVLGLLSLLRHDQACKNRFRLCEILSRMTLFSCPVAFGSFYHTNFCAVTKPQSTFVTFMIHFGFMFNSFLYQIFKLTLSCAI